MLTLKFKNYFVSIRFTVLRVLQEQILVVCQCLNRCEIENMLNQKCIVKNTLRSMSLHLLFGWLLKDHLLWVCFFSFMCGNKGINLCLCFIMQGDIEHFVFFWYRHSWQYGVFNLACQPIHWQMLPVDPFPFWVSEEQCILMTTKSEWKSD